MAINNTIAILAALLIAAGLGAQFGAYLNIDNAWLLHVAESVASGQVLHRDVVETNPPLIVYLMSLPVGLAKLLGVSIPVGFVLFMGGLCAASLGMACSVVKDRRIQLCLVFGLFFMPGYNFGEREHIFVVLILPYLVSLWSNQKRSLAYLIISAVMAGVALSLKPFFLLVWGFVVLVQMALDRKWFGFWTLQNVIIGVIVVTYPLYLIFVEKDYIEKVLPLMINYYGGFRSPLVDLLRQSFAMVFMGQIAFWILLAKDKQVLTRPIYFMAFANVAGVLVMMIQGKVWSNYFYPPGFFSFMTNAMITLALMDGNVKPLWNKVAAVIASFMVVVFLTMAIAINLKTGLRVKEEDEARMVELLDKHASGRNVMALSFDLGTVFPAVMHSEATYSLRHGQLWMIPGVYKGEKPVNRVLAYHPPEQMGVDEARLYAQVIQDLEKTRPAVVVVVKSDYHSPNIGDYKFDFIEYFSMNTKFASLWKNYEKVAQIGEEGGYIKEIYALKAAE